MQKEIWKDIPEFTGHYQVSNLGRVKSLSRFCVDRHRTGALIKPDKNANYHRVTLSKDRKPKRFSIHRLVAICFIPNPNNKPQVNHINGIKTDNRLDNLEWCTASENINHAISTGLYIPPSGAKNKQSKPVAMIDVNTGKVLNVFHSAVVAQKLTGVYRTGIRNCCTGRKSHAGGYKWEYLEQKFNIDKSIDSHKQYL